MLKITLSQIILTKKIKKNITHTGNKFMKYKSWDNEKLVQFKNVILILLIIIDLIFIFTITFFELPLSEIKFMAYFDLFVCILLFINLLYEYKNKECSTKQFLKEHIIDIISIIPFNFIFLRYLTVFRVIRIIQILQVIRIYNIKKDNVYSLKYFVQNQLLKTMIIILTIYMVLSSIILFAIDPSFNSVFQSFWYGIVTITGVGYGDITPISTVGRIIGMLTIIIGLIFISVFTAAMSGIYMEKNEEETRTILKDDLKMIIEENNELKNDIKEIKEENIKLNKKIDELIELIKRD